MPLGDVMSWLLLLIGVVVTAILLARHGEFSGSRLVAVIVLTSSVALSILVLYPLLKMLSESVFEAAWLETLTGKRLWRLDCLGGAGRCGAAWNTLLIAFWTALLSTGCGAAMALLATRICAPGGAWSASVRLLALLPLITPPFVVGMGFILLFGRAGLANELLEVWLHIPPGRWLYGMDGILLTQVFAFTPLAFLICSATLERLPTVCEESAHTLGADSQRAFLTVTLPLAKPGLITAFVVCFVESAADLGNPLVVGGNVEVLATEIYLSIVGAAPNPAATTAYSTLLLAVALVLFYGHSFVLGRGSFAANSKGGLQRLPLPSSVRVVSTLVAGAWCVLTLAVFVLIFVGGFVRSWGRDYEFTWEHYARVFALEPHSDHIFVGAGWDSLFNSVVIAMWVAPATVLLGVLFAWVVSRYRFFGRQVFSGLTLLPIAIPGAVLGVAYVLSFNEAPLELTGTALIIGLCLFVRELPIAVRTGSTALASIDGVLDEASATLGASSLQTFLRVTLPLLRSCAGNLLAYGFIRALTSLSAVIFMVSAGQELATTFIMNRVTNGDYGVAVAYSTVLIGISVVMVLVGNHIAKVRTPVHHEVYS